VKDLAVFRRLSPHQQMQVCIGVLIDASDVVDVLATDSIDAQNLKRAAKDLTTLSPDIRMPLVGTLLRTALEAIEQE